MYSIVSLEVIVEILKIAFENQWLCTDRFCFQCLNHQSSNLDKWMGHDCPHPHPEDEDEDDSPLPPPGIVSGNQRQY